MRSWLRITLTVALVAGFAPQVADAAGRVATEAPAPPPSPANPNNPITDPALITAMSTATRVGADRADTVPTVSVEVVTGYSDAVRATIHSLGGAITGGVADQIVQARMPVAGVDTLALARGVTSVRAPQLVTRPPREQPLRPEVGPGFGSTVGQNVSITNASAWQAAGISGAVKVGIVDYFDFGLWNTSEEGPIPDGAHHFCLDSSTATSDPDNLCSSSHNDGINTGDGFEHGVAVSQVVKDMAPGAELYLASAGTVSDLQAAINWFAQNGVRIVTRSLGAAYDGPGNGTGPLDTVVDSAAAQGITWFNSAGNDASDGYVRVAVPANLTANGGYIDFDNSAGVDTYLRISGSDVLLDGIRWSDWNLPPDQRTGYSVEVYVPTSNPDTGHDENYNPPDLQFIGSFDPDQPSTADPLKAADEQIFPNNTYGFADGISYIRIKRQAGTPTVGAPDVLELGIAEGYIELGRSQAPYSAAKPVVDSANPELVAVGAVDPANGGGTPDAIAYYSSQGPTNDGRIKPDISAPSCVSSTIYSPGCFNGTSAASPTAAGVAALLLDAGVAQAGTPLVAAMKHFVFDRAFAGAASPPDGPDNKYGSGEILLPAPPTAPGPQTTSLYHPLEPVRILDTRNGGSPALSAQPQYGIVDLTVAGAGDVPSNATAVALNITSTDGTLPGFIQAIPFLQSTYGTSSTLNIATAGQTKANFAIVPIGNGGKISIYDVPGGNLIVDVLGYYSKTSAPTDTAGRFVPIDPVRTLDTRTSNLVPAGWSAHEPFNESVSVPTAGAVPTTGVAALVLNVTSTDAVGPGYLRAAPDGTSPLTSTVNYDTQTDAANSVIVPLGTDGGVNIYTSNRSDIVVDITGYITSAAAPAAATGRFVALPTPRAYDSRTRPEGALAAGSTRTVQLVGQSAPLPVVPVGASGISINLTTADEVGSGYLSAYPSGGSIPATSSLNFVTGQPVANGAMLKLSAGGALDFTTNQTTSVIIDVDGYFT
ncbi:MAG TPA: S8 family serine peptidase [Ilumatobacteraceae bacterium]